MPLAAIANDFETVADKFKPKNTLTCSRRLLNRQLISVLVTPLKTIGCCWGGWPPRTLEAAKTKEVIPVWQAGFCPRFQGECAVVVGQKH
jgi:hypothetical protein